MRAFGALVAAAVHRTARRLGVRPRIDGLTVSSRASPAEYDAVLFDNDGVLVEPPARATLRSAVESALRAVELSVEPTDEVADPGTPSR